VNLFVYQLTCCGFLDVRSIIQSIISFKVDEQAPKNTTVKILTIGLATVGLTFWAGMLAITLFENEPSDSGVGIFTNPLDFLMKISGLLILFPVAFNLLVLFGGLLLGKGWKILSLNFVYAVIYEFGLLWAILIIGYFCLY